MANQDSFIDEVTEEVRRDRLFRLFRRYGWIAGVAVLLIVGGAAVNELRKARAQAEAEALGDAILTALEEGDPLARQAALGAVAPLDTAEKAAIVTLLASGQDTDGPNPEQVAALEALSANPDLSAAYRDLAALRAVMLQGRALAPDARIAALQPLALPGAPYRLVALEQIALARVEAGDTALAIADFETALNDNDASEGLRRRAAQAIVALGGTPGGS